MKVHITFCALTLGFTSILSEVPRCLGATTGVSDQVKAKYNRSVGSKCLPCLVRRNNLMKSINGDLSAKPMDRSRMTDLSRGMACRSRTLVDENRSHVKHNGINTFQYKKYSDDQNCRKITFVDGKPGSREHTNFEISQSILPFVTNGIYPYGL